MSGEQEAMEGLSSVIAEVGKDPKNYRMSTDIKNMGQTSSILIWRHADLMNDQGIIRLIANGVAAEHGVRVTSKKGNGNLAFYHSFEEGKREFDKVEIAEILDRIDLAILHMEAAVSWLVEKAVGATS